MVRPAGSPDFNDRSQPGQMDVRGPGQHPEFQIEFILTQSGEQMADTLADVHLRFVGPRVQDSSCGYFSRLDRDRYPCSARKGTIWFGYGYGYGYIEFIPTKIP